MVIEIALIPTSGDSIPQTATHGRIATLIQSNGDPPSDTPAGGWRGVERETRSNRVVLRLPGTLADYDGATLDGLATSITGSLDVEAHPDGWTEVDA